MFEKLSAIITERKQKRGLYLQVEAALVLKYFLRTGGERIWPRTGRQS
jgi:hypothetical protein